MIERGIDTAKLMAIGLGGFVLSLIFGENVVDGNPVAGQENQEWKELQP